MKQILLDRPQQHADPDRSGHSTAGPAPTRDRLEHACGVLEAARGVIERGWLQHGWYLIDRPRPRSFLARLRQAERPPAPTEVRRACLVAAIALAAHGGGRSDPVAAAGPALDLVWDALWTSGEPDGPVTGKVPAPAIRAARMRELVHWNDTAGRTRDEVLGLLDQAISRGIMGAVSAPADQRPAVGSTAR